MTAARLRAWISALVLAAVAGGCGDGDSVLTPAGPHAHRTAQLTWVLFAAATVVTVAVFALLGLGLARRPRHAPGHSDRGAERWIILGGVVLPILVIVPIAALSVDILNDRRPPGLQVEVIGHQYWWEYRYPALGVVTANELHVPVDTDVDLTLTSDDVIHSFWVPALAGKIDLVPGHANAMSLRADTAGTFRGRCAEFCGLQHAKMQTIVVAEPAARFDAWVQGQRTPASDDAAMSEPAATGRELFATQGCAACHTVRGTSAVGLLGPDLTHIASRQTLAAGVLDNTRANLRLWIGDTWAVKDHVAMPPLPLTADELDGVVAYLETLR